MCSSQWLNPECDNEELKIEVLLYLFCQFFVCVVKVSLDGQATKRHAKWLGGRAGPLTEFRCEVVLRLITGNELGQFDLVLVA